MNNYYCLKCKHDFKSEKNKCPKCGKRAKMLGTDSFYTHGENLPK